MVPWAFVFLTLFPSFWVGSKLLVQTESMACWGCQHPHLLSYRYNTFIFLSLTKFLHVVGPLRFCIHETLWMLYTNRWQGIADIEIACTASAHVHALLSHQILLTKPKHKNKIIKNVKRQQSIQPSTSPLEHWALCDCMRCAQTTLAQKHLHSPMN